jgi:hypothetical protein
VRGAVDRHPARGDRQQRRARRDDEAVGEYDLALVVAARVVCVGDRLGVSDSIVAPPNGVTSTRTSLLNSPRSALAVT